MTDSENSTYEEEERPMGSALTHRRTPPVIARVAPQTQAEQNFTEPSQHHASQGHNYTNRNLCAVVGCPCWDRNQGTSQSEGERDPTALMCHYIIFRYFYYFCNCQYCCQIKFIVLFQAEQLNLGIRIYMENIVLHRCHRYVERLHRAELVYTCDCTMCLRNVRQEN